MPRAELIVENGRMAGRHYVLEEGRSVTIGRSVQSDFQLSDQGISRLHCKIDNQNGKISVTDLGSSNGTRVDQAEITGSHELKDEERVFCGTTAIRMRISDSTRNSVRKRAAGNTSIQIVKKADTDTSEALRKTFLPGTAPLDPIQGDDPALVKSRKRLNVICGLGESLQGRSNFDAILEEATDTILDLTGADRGAILMEDESTGELLPVATKTADGNTNKEIRVSSTVVTEVMQEGLSVITSDAANDERFQNGASIVLENIHSVMCVPLRTREKIIGVIYVDSTSLGSIFEEEDLALLAAVGNQTGVAIERTRLVRDLEHLFVGAMHAIVASLEAKDAYTRGHSERVTAYALMIADELGLDETERGVVELAGLMHDVGKIGVPEAVLCKPGRLTDEEFTLIQEHPALGAKILEKMPEMERLVNMNDIVTAVRHHHERFSGGGYPDGLAGEAIPMTSRILSAADTYDAIAGDRVYRKGRGPSKAMEIIHDVAGEQLDPRIVAALESVHAKGELAHPERVEGRFNIHQLNMNVGNSKDFADV